MEYKVQNILNDTIFVGVISKNLGYNKQNLESRKLPRKKTAFCIKLRASENQRERESIE